MRNSLSLEHRLLQIKEAKQCKAPAVSFEFFPPKSEVASDKLAQVVAQLLGFKPYFCSVTYGAGGTTQAGTALWVEKIQNQFDVPTASHLTCVNASRDEIDAIAARYWELGIKRIVALRGDMPSGQGKYQPHPSGYAYADDLVKGLRAIADFDISVSGYPEVHPEAISPKDDILHLKRKQDAGATRIITQYCFDSDRVLRFMDDARKAGVTIPIIPGVLPIYNIKQAVDFSARCGASTPAWLLELFACSREDAHRTELVSTILLAEQCRLFVQEGIEALHFYTLNRAEQVSAVCQVLGLGA